MSRSVAIYLVYFALFIFIVLTSLYFVPGFVKDLQDIAETMPGHLEIFQRFMTNIYGIGSQFKIPTSFLDGIASAISNLENQFIIYGEKSVEMVFLSAEVIWYLLLTPMITYYILRDINMWRHKITIKMAEYPLHYMNVIKDIDRVFAGFIRGQSLIALFVAIMVWLVTIALKLKYGAVLGVLSGLGEFIPYLGPAIGNIPLICVAFLKSPTTGFWALGLIAFIQWFDSSVMVPRVTGERVGLHPLWVIFAVLAGSQIFGRWGVFLAVPLAGIFRVLLKFVSICLDDLTASS